MSAGAIGCQNRSENANIQPVEKSFNIRIVALAPSVTETLFAVGAGKDVVGVSEYCDFPPAATRLPKVGTFLTPNLEAIAALQPTMVIGLSSAADVHEVRALDAMGFGVLMVNDDTIAGIRDSIVRIGAAVGRTAAADAVVRKIQSRFAAIETTLRNAPNRRVLMVVGHQPMVAVGRGTYLDQLITLAHGTNIADADSQSWPRLSLEYIIAARPQVILDGQMGTDASAKSGFWSRYSEIPAVRDGRIYGYPDDPTLHPGPRVAESLLLIAERIHPEAFRAVATTAAIAQKSKSVPARMETKN
jgi:iron complex transport system substrate-binding protein